MISEKVEGWEATLIWSGHPNKLKLLPKHSFCSRMYWHLRHFRKTHFVHNAGFIHSTVLPTSLNTFPYYLLHHCPFLHTSELRCSMLPHTFFLLLHISLSKKSLLLKCSLMSQLGLVLHFDRKDTHHQGLFISRWWTQCSSYFVWGLF